MTDLRGGGGRILPLTNLGARLLERQRERGVSAISVVLIGNEGHPDQTITT
jgi:hypothetical protein